MGAGLQDGRGRRLGPALVFAAAVLLLARSAPLARAYADKLLSRHSAAGVAVAAAGSLAVFLSVWTGLRKRPRATAAAFAATAAAMVALSGNLGAALAAAAILLVTFVAGDAVYRVLRGTDAARGDLSTALAAGFAASGVAVLLLGEAGVLGRGSVLALAAIVVGLRRRRFPALGRLVREAVRLPRGDAPASLEAAWLAFAALALLAVWAGVQAPDVSWDALAYHLPEARDIALTKGVRPLPDLHPQSLLWRNHEAFLSIAFFFGDERVVPYLQFAAGLAVFGAALSLARRLRLQGSGPLVVLAMAAFPTAMLQLKAAYVDWPAALLVTAAAAEVAANPGEHGRMRVAGFPLRSGGRDQGLRALRRPRAPCGGISRTPAADASLRRGPLRPASARALARLEPAPRRIVSGAVRRLTARAGGRASPKAATSRGRRRPGRDAPFRRLPSACVAFVRLPYDLVFHSSRFEANGDGYNGILALLFVAGLAGWSGGRIGLFLAVTLPFLVPWSLLYLPSIRFLFPVYPLYAVFTAGGLSRLTARFAGAPGLFAGLAVLASAAAFPVQAGSSGLEWKAAFGWMSRSEVLAAQLPALPLQSRLRPADRVVFVGENDRFHCPAALVWRAEFLPVAAWGSDPAAWRRGFSELGIDAVLLPLGSRTPARRPGVDPGAPPAGRRPRRGRPVPGQFAKMSSSPNPGIPSPSARRRRPPSPWGSPAIPSPFVSTLRGASCCASRSPSGKATSSRRFRYARRAMIREERSRSLDWDEPSMEDPTISGTEIRWFALASQASLVPAEGPGAHRARQPRPRGDPGASDRVTPGNVFGRAIAPGQIPAGSIRPVSRNLGSLARGGTGFATSMGMRTRIGFSEIEEVREPIGFSGGAAAPQLEERQVTLRCRLLATDGPSLEALRYARRAMLREEWTLGPEEDEPSLEDAVFSAFEVTWPMRASQSGRGRARLAELVERANRARRELDARG